MEKIQISSLITKVDDKMLIRVPRELKHLTELSDLPAGIINKKETGCGATTLFLESSEDVIICCPTKQLIINKANQYPNTRCDYHLQQVMQGVSTVNIKDYIKWCEDKQPVKIMTTYDSFSKVVSAVGSSIKNYRIIVDEYQELLSACTYRNSAIKKLLYLLKDYSNVTCLSATPIPFQYTPEELKHLTSYEIEWPTTKRVKPIRIHSPQPITAASNIIKKHKEGKPFEINGNQVEHYFFFVNSVTTISHIIKSNDLKASEVKIICADNDDNRRKLGDFKIENADGNNKTFTFCTKTVFCGTDFYSNAGLIFIVSDGYVSSSLLDISTDIIQIAGRIRTPTNFFKNMIIHIYNTGILCDNKEEFLAEMNIKIKNAENTVKAYQSLKPELQGALTMRINNNDPEEFNYYNEETNVLEIDQLKLSNLKYKFESINEIYTNGLSIKDKYLEAGFDVETADSLEPSVRRNIFSGMDDCSFRTQYNLYLEERHKYSDQLSTLAADIEITNPLIKEAYTYLGSETVTSLQYNAEKIANHLYFLNPETQSALKAELSVTFHVDKVYTNKEIKRLLGLCFEKLRITKTAKATVLKNYFATTKVKISTEEANTREEGYKITGKLFFCYYNKLSTFYNYSFKSAI